VRRRSLVAALAVAATVLGPTPAAAQSDVSVEELRALARRAPVDRRALERLRQVETVQGLPVRMDVVLDDAAGDTIERRLALLADDPLGTGEALPTDGAASGVGDPRAAAERILAGDRFHPPDQPRPLRGVLRWIGARLEPVLRQLEPVGRPLATAWRALTAGAGWSLLAGGIVVLLAFVFSLRLVRRRGRRLASQLHHQRESLRALDPVRLEDDADAAARVGRYDEAFRLRFLAGLVRLDRAGVIVLRPSLTAGGLARQVPGTRALAARFEEIVYGGQPASPEDVEQARRDWPRLVEAATP